MALFSLQVADVLFTNYCWFYILHDEDLQTQNMFISSLLIYAVDPLFCIQHSLSYLILNIFTICIKLFIIIIIIMAFQYRRCYDMIGNDRDTKDLH